MTENTLEAPRAEGHALALTILQDKMVRILADSGPKKTGELVAALNMPLVNLHLAKHALRSSSRFTQVQRKWDLMARWEAPEVPFQVMLRQVMLPRCCNR